MKPLTWQHVTIVLALLVGIVTLSVFGRDATSFIAIGTLIMAGLGILIQQGSTIREQTNGRIGQLVELVAKQGEMLAAALPPAPIVVTAATDTPAPPGAPVVDGEMIPGA